jgi:hypothetical protein
MPLPFIEAAEVVTGQRDACCSVYGLNRFSLNRKESGPERFMSLRNHIDGAFKNVRVQRALDAEADGNVKSRIAGA